MPALTKPLSSTTGPVSGFTRAVAAVVPPGRVDELVHQLDVPDADLACDGPDQVVGLREAVDERVEVQAEGEAHHARTAHRGEVLTYLESSLSIASTLAADAPAGSKLDAR